MFDSRHRTKNVSFAFALGLLIILGLEGALHVVARVLASPLVSIPHTVPDEALGYRPNPKYPGHDRNGFRNERVPPRVDVVALGDSQTYGMGVAAEYAWPRQLKSLTSYEVYSMAYGGYGPAHSLILWEEACRLGPNIVVAAFYAGNDLYDSFNLVYNSHRRQDLKTKDDALQQAVKAKEKREPLAERVARLFNMESITVDPLDKPSAPKEKGFSLGEFFRAHSRLVRWAGKAKQTLTKRLSVWKNGKPDPWQEALIFAREHKAFCEVFDNGTNRTIFTPAYRLTALDLNDPRISEGHRISLRALREMDQLASALGIRFIVLLIPSKEMVYRTVVRNRSAFFSSLLQQEERFLRKTKAFLEQYTIEYVDTLPALRSQLPKRNQQPYKVSHDGHPNRFGYQAIAEALSSQIRP